MPLNLVGSPFWVSGGTIVGSDPQMRPWTAKGCTQGAPVSGVSGEAVASPIRSVVADLDPKGLRQVNVESGRWRSAPAARGVNVRTAGETVAALAGRCRPRHVRLGLRRRAQNADRADWQVTEGRRVGRRWSFNSGGTAISANGRSRPRMPTWAAPYAGDRLIVYSRARRGRGHGWQSVVYDPRSGQSRAQGCGVRGRRLRSCGTTAPPDRLARVR